MKIIRNVEQDDEGIRLDKWFYRHHNRLPFTAIAKFVRKGFIRVNGKRSEVSCRLKAGDLISFPSFILKSDDQIDGFTEQNKTRSLLKNNITKEQKKLIENIKNSALYEDKDVLIINKPSNIATQGGTKVGISIDDISHLIFDHPNLEKLKLRLVHRLDKDTSGALILAKSAKVAADIATLIRGRQLEKKYIAILCGVPQKHNGIIDEPLSKKSNETIVDALTEYRVLCISKDKLYSLVEFNLHTGRMHQLRRHSAHIGCPIFGDAKYGIHNDASKKSKHLYLHSHKIKYTLYDKIIKVEAEPQEYFIAKCKELGLILK